MEEEKDFIVHKVQAGYNYTVYRSENNGKVFHKIGIEQKTADGQKIKAYLPVKFNSGIDVADRTRIKIKKGYENFYFSKNDPRHFNPLFYIQITEFENISDVMQNYNEAINNTDEDDFLF